MSAVLSPYGTWATPISSRLTTESGVGLGLLSIDGDPKHQQGKVYWNEVHFDKGGSYVICSADKDGKRQEWTPKGFNARTVVHEYGGGDFFVYKGTVYFSNFSDQVLYKQTSPDAQPEPVTETGKAFRYADGRYNGKHSRIYCVREDHEVLKNGAKEAQNALVAINPTTKSQCVLRSGADFYSSPRITNDGKKIAWVQWMHPNMPWDSTELWVAELSDSGDEIIKGTETLVIGGKDASGEDLSIMLPQWTEDGELLYIGDQTDWWNLYLVTSTGDHINLHEVTSEVGGPQWGFGRYSYALEPNGTDRIVTAFDGEFGILGMKTKEYKKIETGFTSHSSFSWSADGFVYCTAHSGTHFACVIKVDMKSFEVTIVRESMKVDVDKGYFSIPQRTSWPTANDETSHGLYYPPTNKDYSAPEGELPPLLVRAHGGPTSAYTSALDLKLQYFTSRGFAVVCVDYRGSTGYGKKYRHRLRKEWGILDVEDCCSAVKYLVSQNQADPQRICIDGGSAGGYTTLACLTFTDVFKVGVSHYGIGDLAILMEETHKFESRYLENLLAPLDQEGRELCKQRSPIHHTDKLSTAMGFFQGDEDKIVPPNQAQMMYDVVKSKGLPTMMVLFKGEQHGFRKAENIQTSLDGEFYFFSKVLGFTPADKHIQLHIDNI